MRARFLLVVAFLLAGSSRASAQGIRIDRIDGALEFGTEISLQQVESPEAPKREFDRLRFDERIDLRLEGIALTDEFLRFRLGGMFGLRQERLDVSGAADTAEIDENPLGYDVLLSLLPKKPISLLAFASRVENDLIQNFGTDTESESRVLGSTLNVRLPMFPSTLTWQELDTESQTEGGFVLSRRAETRRLLQYSGSHISETTHIGLRLRDEDVDDRSLPPVGDYDVEQADGVFGYRWGDYLEKSWRTTARYFERQGSFDFENSATSSHFLWDITETLRTQLRYDFDQFDTEGQRTINNSGFFSLDHQLYESLNTSFSLSADRSEQTTADRSTYGGDLSLGYRKRVPLESRLLVDLDLRYRVEDSDVDSTQGLITGEQLLIADFVGNFLVNRNIDTSTIQVFENLGGALLLEGIDYFIDVIGDRTSINPLVGGALNVGDVVSVNYQFARDPSAKIATTGWGAGVGWQIGWFSISYEHDQRYERLLEGDESAAIDDARRDTLRMDLRGSSGDFRFGSSALYREDRTGTLDYDETSFRQDMTWRPSGQWEVTVRMVETFRDFLDPDRETDTFNAAVSVGWRPRILWSVRAFGDFRDLNDSESLDQMDLRFGARAELNFGKVDVTPIVTWTRRERGESETRDLRAILRFRRRF